jgi:RHS repeat-associated protein
VQTDPNGLLYMRARYYNPYLCRFLNADPAGFSASLNFYAYADGNPISLIDPFGLGAVEAAGGGSWLTRAFAGTALGDWMRGFEQGLQAWVAGEDLSRYTWSGSDKYLEGVTSGYKAVPNLVEVASFVAMGSAGGSATRAIGTTVRAEASVAGKETTYLYQKVGTAGEHLKFGITGNPATRYTAAELNGGQLRIIAQGERSEMLSLESSSPLPSY